MSSFYDLNKKKSVISFHGNDAEGFLQGQMTCDVADIKNNEGKLGALCNPKGRVVCLFHLLKQADAYFMIVNSALSTQIIKRLQMYKFRSDVHINDVSEQYTILGSISSSIQNTNNTNVSLTTIMYAAHTNLTLTVIENEQLKLAIDNDTFFITHDTTEWEQAMTTDCLPEITPATSELFIPQMLNLDVLDGISFQKGCYTGQEVIARLHYKGTVKRRLFSFESNVLIPPGVDIFSSDDKNSIGTIVSCTEVSNSCYSGTVIIKNIFSNQSTINCDEFGKVSIKPPPYLLNS
jgi:folate-binding protein YgfZ